MSNNYSNNPETKRQLLVSNIVIIQRENRQLFVSNIVLKACSNCTLNAHSIRFNVH